MSLIEKNNSLPKFQKPQPVIWCLKKAANNQRTRKHALAAVFVLNSGDTTLKYKFSIAWICSPAPMGFATLAACIGSDFYCAVRDKKIFSNGDNRARIHRDNFDRIIKAYQEAPPIMV